MNNLSSSIYLVSLIELNNILEKLGYGKTEISRKIGVNRSAYSLWTRGLRECKNSKTIKDKLFAEFPELVELIDTDFLKTELNNSIAVLS